MCIVYSVLLTKMPKVNCKIDGFCMKCRVMHEITNPETWVMKGKGDQKRDAVRGTCKKHGNKMSKIMSNADKKRCNM